MQPPTDPTAAAEAPAPEPDPPAEVRQRWRLTFRRGAVPAELVGRAAIEAWQAALGESGLALAQLDAAGRPRIAFAAPLPAASEGEAELAEIFLAERIPAWRLREAIADRLPAGHELLSAEDVWLGAPALPGRVVAADWRVELEPAGIDRDTLEAAAERLLAAASLPRTRSKGGADKLYDLRPLLDDIRVTKAVAGEPVTGERVAVGIRTRFRPELGSGRPEEVVAALGESAGTELLITRIVREGLVLA
ncbi:MAG TPA: TIGR03936 family radical SAM-associated protein [Candidatus Limnocylindrales bacterium]|nr:TIGR03936 family radical SAM-associated protein [Candidatus Limnocylindrales bacterium]